MKSLPQTDETLLIRTDFSDEAAWQALRTAITTPNEDDFLAYCHIVDDPDHRDLTVEQVLALAPATDFLIVADKAALTSPEMPLLAVLRYGEDDKPGDEPEQEPEQEQEQEQEHGELRVVAEELWSIENNISLANMDWEEFVDGADDDGVFRGF